MLSFLNWSICDTVIALIQVVIVVIIAVRFRRKIGSPAAVTLALCAWFFVSPADFLVSFNTNLAVTDPRFVPWVPVLPFGLSINNSIIVIYVIYIFSYYLLITHKRISKWILLFFVAIICGNVGALFTINNIDFHTLFGSDKIAALIIASGIAMTSLKRQNGNRDVWYFQYLWMLFAISMLSTISMLLLLPALRDSRDWGYAIIQSQYSLTIFVVLFVHAIFSDVRRWKALLAYIVAPLVGFLGHYKYVMLMLPVILLFRLIAPFLARFDKRIMNNVIFLGMLISPVVVVFLLNKYVPAISTRYFQILNAAYSFYNNGIITNFFGLGWDQWYHIHFPFKFIDYYAWNPVQLENADYKYSIQTSAMSVIFDSGLLGSLFFFGAIYNFYIRSFKNRKFNFFSTLLIAALMVNILLLFPNIAPEGAMLLVIIGSGLVNDNLIRVDS